MLEKKRGRGLFRRVGLMILPFFGMMVFGTMAMARAGAILSPVQQQWVVKIEQHLANVRTVQAKFRQVAANGQVSTGMFVLARPGRMRFTYDLPSPLLLVANHGKVVFQDRSIDQVTTLPLKRTPLGLLLRSDPHFFGDVTITDFQKKGERIQLRVVQTGNLGEGMLTLFFSTTPLALEGWNLIDPQGRKTVLRLSDVHEGVDVSEELFVLPKAQ